MSAESLIFECCLFHSRVDNHPQYRGKPWSEIAKLFILHKERREKDGPLWSPAVYKGAAPRGNTGVDYLTAAVGDFDEGIAYEAVKDRFVGFEYVAHSTHSHTPEHPKFRVIIPLGARVPATDWPDIKARLDEHLFGSACDPGTKDPSRIYYMPSCPPGAPRFAEHVTGDLLDPYQLPPASKPVWRASETEGHAEPTGKLKVQLGKKALDFVANGAPIGKQRASALLAARNYLSAGYLADDAAEAIWRGLKQSPQEPGKEAWTLEDATAIVANLDASEAPNLPLLSPEPPRSDIRKVGLGYECIYPVEGVCIMVDHLHRRSDGLKGEVKVQTTVPGAPRDLYGGLFGLSTLSARASMAKHLGKRCEGSSLSESVWEFILEDFCAKVIQAERQGEPLMRIGKERVLIQPSWLVTNAILKNDIGTLYGPGQNGKSRLALAWALSVLTGIEFVPGFHATETGEIIYMDWETNEARIAARCQMLCAGLGIDPVDLWYQPCKGVSFVDMYEKTIRDVAENNVKLVVLDSVEAATAGTREGGADQNAAIMLLYQALRHLNTSVLLIDHVNSVNAGSTEGVRKPYGSIFKYNYARYAFELRNQENRKQPGDERMVLKCTKYNDGSTPKTVGLHVTFDGMKTTYENETIPDIKPHSEGGPTNLERVMAVMDATPLTYAELAIKTGLDISAVRNVVSGNHGLFLKDNSSKETRIERNPFHIEKTEDG